MKSKLFFLLVSLFSITSVCKAQNSESKCVHYPYNTQIGISLNANLTSSMNIEPHSDYFHSYPSLGAGLGVYLYQRVYKWFGIQIGVEYTHVTVRYGGSETFTTSHEKRFMKYYTDMLTFPILFNFSYYFNERHGLDISLGGAPLIMPMGQYFPPVSVFRIGEKEYNENGDSYEFTLADYPRFGFCLYGKIGYNFLFKNKNSFGVAIIGSYTADSYAQGWYYVKKNKKREEEGRVYLCNSFLGLQFSYGFSMKKTLCIP